MRLPYLPGDVQNKLLKANLELLATRGKPQEDFISSNISDFETSDEYKVMLDSENYYINKNDIKNKKRKAINEKGALIEDLLLPNNRLSHPDLRNIIDEKVAYAFSKPFSIKCDNGPFLKLLNEEIFTPKFRNKLKMVAKDCYKKGKSYLQPSFDADGKLIFNFRPGHTIIPFWADEEHTILDAFILYFKIKIYALNGNYEEVDYVEFVDESGTYRYIRNADKILKPYEDDLIKKVSGHFTVAVESDEVENNIIKEMNWEKIPLIAFKPNADEYPILRSVKSLIDGYDTTASDLADAIGDLPYSIKVITNYDGQDLGELAKNLYTYRMVKVSDGGDVKSLTQTIDTASINSHLDRLKEDICQYGRVVNDKSAIAVNASGKALDRLYNKIDLDGSDIIQEFQSSLDELLWFVKWYYKNTGKGDFTNEKVEFVFNTDKPTDETSIISNCVSSKGIISDETIISNHPWVTDINDELEKLKKQREEQMNELLNMPNYGSNNLEGSDNIESDQGNEETDNQEE